MKKAVLVSALVLASTGAIAKEEFKGVRVAAGYVAMDSSDVYLSEKPTGLTAEIGYDFNRIMGISLRMAQTEGQSIDYDHEDLNIDVNTYGIYSDIGYAIPVGFASIKPYGLLGIEKGEIKSVHGEASDSSFVFGTGVRATFDSGLTMALEYKVASFSDEYGDLSVDALSATVGYRF